MTGAARSRRPTSLLVVWVAAAVASVVVYVALGAIFLVRGLSGANSGRLAGAGFLAAVLAPLIVAARLTWARHKRGRS